MVVLLNKKKKKKKKRQTPLTTPRKRSVEGRCQRWKRDLLSSPQFGGGWSESTSQQTAKQPPGHGPQLQAQLEKVASTSLATIGARSSFSGVRLAHEFPRSFLVAAIIFPHTKWLKKITDYRDTPALKTDTHSKRWERRRQENGLAWTGESYVTS